MTGHKRWEVARNRSGAPKPAPAPTHRPPLCRECGKRVRRWQSYGGWGPMGFTVKTADLVWHTKCMRSRDR